MPGRFRVYEETVSAVFQDRFFVGRIHGNVPWKRDVDHNDALGCYTRYDTA